MDILLFLSTFAAFTAATKLPEAYLSELEKYIPRAVLSASTKEIETRLYDLLAPNSTDFCTFYSQIAKHRGELERMLTRHCGKEQECLHVCGLLIDVLELVHRERSFNKNLFQKPKNLDRSVLVHMLKFRAYEHKYIICPNFYCKAMNAIKRSMTFALRNVQLWHNLTQRRHFEKVIGMVAERHAFFLKQFIQRSASSFLNSLYDISCHIYPRMHTGSVALSSSSAHAWYIKINGCQPSPIDSLFALEFLLKKCIGAFLSCLKDNPWALNMEGFRILITNLLYAHQRLLEFDFSSLSVSEKSEYLKLDEKVLQLYTSLEEVVLPKVLNHLIASVIIIHNIDLKQSVELRLTTGTHMIDKFEVYLVEYEVSKSIVFTICIRESTLKIFIFKGNIPFAYNNVDIEKDICNVIQSKPIFTEDLLQSLLKDKISRKPTVENKNVKIIM